MMEFYVYNNPLNELLLKTGDNVKEIQCYYDDINKCAKILNRIRIQLWFSKNVIPRRYEITTELCINI